MRIIPLAFVADITNNQIGEVSAITHAHIISKEACILYVRIAQELIKGYSIMEAVRRCTSDFPRFSKLNTIDSFPRDEIRSSGFVIHTLEVAIWSVATTSNYKDCVYLPP